MPLPACREPFEHVKEICDERAAGSRTEFHPLTVGRVERLSDDAVAVTFDVPAELAAPVRLPRRASR